MRAKNSDLKRKSSELLAYVAIAVTLVLAALFYAAHVPPGRRVDFKWVALVVMTVVTFGYPVVWYRRFWRHSTLWLTILALLAVHLIAYVVVLTHVDHFGYLWYAILMPVEWAVFRPILDRVVGASAKQNSEHPRS